MTKWIIAPAALASIALLNGCTHGAIRQHSHATVAIDGRYRPHVEREVRVIHHDAPGILVRTTRSGPPATAPVQNGRFRPHQTVPRRGPPAHANGPREPQRSERRRKERRDGHSSERTPREHREATGGRGRYQPAGTHRERQERGERQEHNQRQEARRAGDERKDRRAGAGRGPHFD